MSWAIIEFLSSKSGLLTGAVLGAAWTFLTILGLHWAVIPIAIANIAIGGDSIIPMAAAAPFAQIGMAIGILIKTKDKELENSCCIRDFARCVGWYNRANHVWNSC